MPQIRIKDKKYKVEQEDFIKRILESLSLDEENSITLYEMDKKGEEIMKFVGDASKYFYISNKACINSKNCKRPWLSLIKATVTDDYNIFRKNITIKVDDKEVHTVKYFFIKQNVTK